TPNPDDGRSYLVGLNAAGEAAHDAAAPLFLAATGRLERGMSSGQYDERAALQRIDAAFRTALELDDRPYSLADEAPSPDGSGRVTYDGAPLTAAQEQQVLQYIDFIRSRPPG
ncbi:MAG TPA: hypothetical protein VFG94_08245, partial [Acidimicrobiales bacterium]|nr:hypothetical protein [Acidimicrobiales bacterium]